MTDFKTLAEGLSDHELREEIDRAQQYLDAVRAEWQRRQREREKAGT